MEESCAVAAAHVHSGGGIKRRMELGKLVVSYMVGAYWYYLVPVGSVVEGAP